MPRRIRRQSRAGFQGGGFVSRKRRPLEWLAQPGREGEAWLSLCSQYFAWTPNQTAAGTPSSDQMDIITMPVVTLGHIVTLTRIVGEIHLVKRAPSNGVYWTVTKCGWQMVPYRTDDYADHRLLFDGDDQESKEWLWQRSYGMGDDPTQSGPEYYKEITGKSSPHFDIKTQRRYDSSMYALGFSIAAHDAAIDADIYWALNARVLFRTGEGL